MIHKKKKIWIKRKSNDYILYFDVFGSYFSLKHSSVGLNSNMSFWMNFLIYIFIPSSSLYIFLSLFHFTLHFSLVFSFRCSCLVENYEVLFQSIRPSNLHCGNIQISFNYKTNPIQITNSSSLTEIVSDSSEIIRNL